MKIKIRVTVFISLLFVPCMVFAGLLGEIDESLPLLELTVIDVWQGDSIYLKLPNGKTVLVDAGMGATDYQSFDAAIKSVVPYLKRQNINHINYIVFSHPHHDHIGGIPVILENFKVDVIYDCGMVYTSEAYMRSLILMDEYKVKYRIPKRGQYLNWDPEVKVLVLGPGKELYDNPNNNSIVLRITYGAVSFMLEGDAEAEEEYDILNTKFNLKSAILKVAHHGSDSSSTEAFLDAVKPECVVISVGKRNKFGHPTPAVMSSFLQRKLKIYRTDYHGDVEFKTDGNKYTINIEKKIDVGNSR